MLKNVHDNLVIYLQWQILHEYNNDADEEEDKDNDEEDNDEDYDNGNEEDDIYDNDDDDLYCNNLLHNLLLIHFYRKYSKLQNIPHR